MRHLLCLLVLIVLAPASAEAVEQTKEKLPPEELLARAESFFETYKHLERTYDPALADLYSLWGDVVIIRQIPGQERTPISMPGKRYRYLVRKLSGTAEAAGDTFEYREVRYEVLEQQVRLTSLRKSELTGRVQPFLLMLGIDPDGEMRVQREVSVAEPSSGPSGKKDAAEPAPAPAEGEKSGSKVAAPADSEGAEETAITEPATREAEQGETTATESAEPIDETPEPLFAPTFQFEPKKN